MKYENDLFIINYNECDKEHIDELISYLNKEAYKIMNFFNLKKLDKKCIIKFYSTKKDFDYNAYYKVYNEQSPDFAIGFANKGIIYYVSYSDYKNIEKHKNDSFDYFKKTLVHEFVHHCNYLYTNIWNRPLCEGLAVYLSGQQENNMYEFNISKENLFFGRINYRQYYMFVKYIIENYSNDYFLKLLSDENFQNKNLDIFYDEANEYYRNYFNELNTKCIKK